MRTRSRAGESAYVTVGHSVEGPTIPFPAGGLGRPRSTAADGSRCRSAVLVVFWGWVVCSR